MGASLLDYRPNIMVPQLLPITTSRASALPRHSTTSCFYSVAFCRTTSTQGLYYLWLLPFAFFMCAPFCLPYNPGAVLPSPSRGLMGSASFPPVPNAQLGKVFASVTVFGGSVRCPLPRSPRALQAMPPPSRTLPYSSASSSFEQETGPAGNLDALSL